MFNPTGSKLIAEINLPFTTKQYKNDDIADFVYLWENSTVQFKATEILPLNCNL